MKYILLLVICSTALFGQSQSNYKNHPFSESLVLSAFGGLTIGNTDFEDTKFGFAGGGMLEYFIPTESPSIFGIRLQLTGNLVTAENTESAPGYKTDLYILGSGISYMYSIKNQFFPYIHAGISYVNFYPKTLQGAQSENSSKGLYSSGSFAYNTEIGIRFLIAKNTTFNIGFNYNFLQSDYLDDISYGDNNDKFAVINAGVSISLFSDVDSDNDGIIDSKDFCADEREDFDGFEDEDGCPEYDNDKDGIADNIDQCPNAAEDKDNFRDEDGCPEYDNDLDNIPDQYDRCRDMAEDFDGYEDSDGCPDLDNDKDGILDSIDQCSNSAEDFDGYQDGDGCPEFDNDGDGIYDEHDRCPDKAENINGYEDNDGCPDVKPISNQSSIKNEKRTTEKRQQETIPSTQTAGKNQISKKITPSSFVLDGVLAFEDDKAKIKDHVHKELDEIADAMKADPNLKWRIEGYIDKSDAKSQSNLGGKRAREVMLYLVKKGVPLSQLEVADLGDKYPRSDSNKPSGRALNRRVEIKKMK